jgi:hypothetical protein
MRRAWQAGKATNRRPDCLGAVLETHTPDQLLGAVDHQPIAATNFHDDP